MAASDETNRNDELGETRGSFADETAIAQVAENLYAAEIRDSWSMGRGPNGGFIAVLLVRALEDTVAVEGGPHMVLRSLTVHFLSPAHSGPCAILTRVERSGRSLWSLSARLEQAGQPCALALSAFAAPRESIVLDTTRMPQASAPDQCPSLNEASIDVLPAFTKFFDYRWAIGDAPFSESSQALAGGWVRPVVPQSFDTALAAALLDSWMPCIYPRVTEPVAAPTIDLTIHFRGQIPPPAAAPDAFYLAAFESRLGAAGFFEEDGTLWSPSGVLLAQSRQLALLPALRES